MNRFECIGRLVADAEIKLASGKSVATFRIAVPRRYKGENGERESDFFNCVAFGKTAETIEKLALTKGTKLFLSGEMRNNNFTGQDGVKRYSVEIVVNDFEFCESKGEARQAADQGETAQQQKPAGTDFVPVPDNVDDEYLPFN